MLIRVSVFIFATVFVLLQGCVAVQTFPVAARAGDTITLALGSVDGLDKTKIQLSYVPQSTGIPINLATNIRSILKIYPDRSSSASMANDPYVASLVVLSGHALWMNVAVVDLPATLPTGPGYFQIGYDASVRQPNTTSVQSVVGKQIAMQILAGSGTGAPGLFSYFTSTPGNAVNGQFKTLEPLPHVVLRPVASTGYNSASHPAAAEFKIKLPITGDVSIMDDSEVNVIWDYKPSEDNKQIQLNWHRAADVLTVNVLVPTSITINEQQMQFSIVVNPSLNGNIINLLGTPQLLSFRYFDLNGNQFTPQLTPEVVVMK